MLQIYIYDWVSSKNHTRKAVISWHQQQFSDGGLDIFVKYLLLCVKNILQNAITIAQF